MTEASVAIPDQGPNGTYWQGVVDTRLSNLERSVKQILGVLCAVGLGTLGILAKLLFGV
jgi:hypothetical protein